MDAGFAEMRDEFRARALRDASAQSAANRRTIGAVERMFATCVVGFSE